MHTIKYRLSPAGQKASILDTILDNHGAPKIVHEQHDISQINWVAGLSDPGEMIACGYLPQLRRLEGEQDAEYAERIRPLVMLLSQEDRDRIMGSALKRANYDASNGKVAAIFAEKSAWSGLGVTVSDAFVFADVLAKCPQLNFHADLWESGAKDPENGYVKVDGVFHVVRTDTRAVLGTVGSKYHVLQVSEVFAMCDGLAGDGVRYETAMSLDGGKRVVVLMRIPKTLKVRGADEQIPYLLASNTYDGSGAVRFGANILRVECQNTYNAAIRDARKRGLANTAIRHTKNMMSKVGEAREKLFLVVKQMDTFEQQANALAAVSMKDTEVTEFYQQWYPTKVRPLDYGSVLEKAIETTGQHSAVVKELIDAHYAESERTAKRNKGILDGILGHFEEDSAAGTAWAAFNAGTNYVDHDQTFRGKTPEEKANSRMNNTTFGAGNLRKQEIFEKVLQLAK